MIVARTLWLVRWAIGGGEMAIGIVCFALGILPAAAFLMILGIISAPKHSWPRPSDARYRRRHFGRL